MPETMIARSPIAPTAPVRVEDGWEVSARRARADLTLSDQTPLAKVQVKAPADGRMAQALGVRFGRAGWDEAGHLVVGSGPGEWLLLAAVNTAAELFESLRRRAAVDAAGEFVTAVDLTHGRALMRITGSRSNQVLAKLCGIDLGDAITPNGAAFRSSVAKLATEVVRDDRAGVRSYLLHCERSSGQYLFDAVLDAGTEFGIEVDGFARPTG